MSTHGRNVFVPFPRYENAVFVGDSAIEALAELKIFGKGASEYAVFSSK